MTSGTGSAERILRILDLFSESRLNWTAEEMTEVLGYSRPTLYRYIKILKEMGFLTQTGAQGLTLGPRVVEMDFLMRKSDVLLSPGQTLLQQLAALHPCTALLVRWYGNKLLCVASESSSPDPRSSYPRGRPMPLARGAISRAILAHLPRRQMIAKIAEHLDDLRDLGLGDTPDQIATRLRALRKGPVIARGEVTEGVVGIAAPVFDDSHAPVAVVGMTLDRAGLDDATLSRLAESVQHAAGQLTQTLTKKRPDDLAVTAI
jgi:DNA-binding IclR family transcriptional regulator